MDFAEVLFIAQTPLARRAQAMYAAQVLLLSTVRARLARAHPELGKWELNRRVLEKLEKS